MFEPPAYGSFPDVLWTTSDLCDAYLPDEAWGVQVVQQALRSFGGHHWYFGEVVTACAPPDASLSLAPILSSPGHGRVLMVEAHADGRHAVFGDRMAGLAVQNGWAGVIVHGYVREAEKLPDCLWVCMRWVCDPTGPPACCPSVPVEILSCLAPLWRPAAGCMSMRTASF